MNDRLFIDECLSASLVAVAKERGLVADFGPHIGMAGWQDWNIVRFALDNGYIVVTNNRRHFLREYLKYASHDGLIVIVPNVDRREQADLFSKVLDYLGSMNQPPANRLIEVLDSGAIHDRMWTMDDHAIDHIQSPAWDSSV